MNLQGLYTIKANGKQFLKHHNKIQLDGFQLLQNWFTSVDNQKIQKVNVELSDVDSAGMYLSGFSNIKQIFQGYKNNYYCKTDWSGVNKPYIDIVFKQRVLQNDTENYITVDKQIVAIGIDVIHKQLTSNTNQKMYNSNIQLLSIAGDTQSNTLFKVEDFTIPVIHKPFNYEKQNYGYKQLIHYLSKPIKASKLRFLFNSNNDYQNITDCRVYAINIYQKKQQFLPPVKMTLYGEIADENGNLFYKQNEVITKDIQLIYPNTINGNYSVVFKTVLQLDELSSTQAIKAISTDYIIGNERKMFSSSEFEQVWYQQALTSIQLQYELFFSNTTING